MPEVEAAPSLTYRSHTKMAMFTMDTSHLVAARTAPRVKPFGWSLGDTRHLGFQNTLISNTPPCAAWRCITDTPVIARCRPRTCPLACPLVALGSIERLLAEFGGRSATPPLGLPLTPIRHRPVVVVRCSHNNQTGARPCRPSQRQTVGRVAVMAVSGPTCRPPC